MTRWPTGGGSPWTGCWSCSSAALSLPGLVAAALAEDLGERGDITSQLLIPADLRAEGAVVARASGVLAGRAAAEEVARQTGLTASFAAADGDALAPGQTVARLEGTARALLAAERTLL